MVRHDVHGFAFLDTGFEQQGKQHVGAGVCLFAYVASPDGLGDGECPVEFIVGGQLGEGAFDAALDDGCGWIIVDDKKSVDLPEGKEIMVEFEGEQRRAIYVGEMHETGVTVHVVIPRVDNGPVVATRTVEFPPGSSQEAIRSMNYRIKGEVLEEALLHYTTDSRIQQLIAEKRPGRNGS